MIAINKTAFAKTEDFTRDFLEVDMDARSFPVGGIPLYTQGNKAYLDTSDSHSIIFGATGSKKTRLFVMPSVEIFYRSGEAFLVTDPKGEIYQKTKDSAALNHYRTFCLDLRNLKTSSQWNPLQLPYELYYNGKKEKALEMLTELSAHIIGDAGEPFWTNVGIDLLLGFLLLLVLNNSCEACTIRNLLRLWNHYTTNEKSFVRALKDKEFHTDELTDSKLRMVYNQADKTVGSAQAIVSTGLNKLIINENLLDLLSTNSISLPSLANEKVGIYLIIPDENSSYHFIASLFISQMYEVLIQVAQTSENKALKVRMNFVIDEFANLPKLNNIDSMITASRSRNMRFSLIVQGLTQLNDKYGSAAQTLCGNCNNWIYLYSKDYELLHTLSNLCGEIVYDTQTKLPLLSEFDLQHLSKENNEVLILSGRKYPYLSHLTDIDDYPFYREAVTPTSDRVATKPRITSKPFSVDTAFEFSPTRKPETPAVTLYDTLAGEKCIPADWFFSKEPKRWVVATLDNIIIADLIVPESILADPNISETLIQRLKGDILGDYLLHNYINFYHADISCKEEFYTYLQNHPEVVYLRLDEMARPDDFIRISTKI